MNDLQKVEFELLKELDSVCRQLDIKYYLVCGSALGAVKYQGFIPWDDDIDVAMLRKDYERFIRQAPEKLRKEFFLQNYHSDPAFPQIFSKLRNSNTTYIEKSSKNLNINHGIFIDVFPLDGYPKEKWKQKKLEFFKRIYSSILLSAFDIPRSRKSVLLCKLYRVLGFNRKINCIAECYEKLISLYSVADSELICNHGNWQGKLEYAPSGQYGEGISAHFETLDVLVPKQYDAYLRQKYGDYTVDLPIEQQVGHHYYEFYDCKVPFVDYLKR